MTDVVRVAYFLAELRISVAVIRADNALMRIACCSAAHLVISGKLHSETAVSTVHQCTQWLSIARFRASADCSFLVDLPAPVPFFLRDDRFMSVWNNDPFCFVLLDELVVLVRYGSRFELYQVSEIQGIVQHLINNRSAPQLAAVQRILLALSLIIILRRTEDSFFIESVSNLSLTESLQPQLKNVFYHRCGFGIDDRQMIRIITHMMSTDGEEHDRAECVYIQLMHGLDECSDEDE